MQIISVTKQTNHSLAVNPSIQYLIAKSFIFSWRQMTSLSVTVSQYSDMPEKFQKEKIELDGKNETELNTQIKVKDCKFAY